MGKTKNVARQPDDSALAAIRAHLPALVSSNPFARYGVHALGLGPKSKGGEGPGPQSVRFYVECKLPLDKVAPDRRVPKTVRVPFGHGEFIDVPTDVIQEARPRLAMPDPESTLRPVPGGASVSVPGSGGNGTLGGWVLDKTDETVVALSNRHVLGGTNGAVVIQPGSNDGGSSPADRIGTVKRTVAFKIAPADPTMADCNLVDAAIVRADDPDLIDLTVIGVGAGVYEIGTASIGDAVQKTGQTTAYTTGIVTDTNYNFIIPVPLTPGNFVEVVFCDCCRIADDATTPLPGFSSFGDSGSIVFGFAAEADAVIHPAIGLLFATAGGLTVACKIEHVFNELNLDVLCASGYPAYLDSLAAEGEEMLEFAGTRFTEAERLTPAAKRPTAGLARDVEKRLLTSAKGRQVSDLVRRYRHPIFAQLIRHSDLRRALTASLGPVLRGSRSSDDVLDYRIGDADLERIARLEKILRREGLDELARAISKLPLAGKKAKGKRVAELLNLDRD